MKPTSQLPLLLITEHFAPGHGATAQLMTDLACGLVSRGIPVTVLTATASNQNSYSELPNKLKVIRIAVKWGESKKVFNKIIKERRKRRRQRRRRKRKKTTKDDEDEVEVEDEDKDEDKDEEEVEAIKEIKKGRRR